MPRNTGRSGRLPQTRAAGNREIRVKSGRSAVSSTDFRPSDGRAYDFHFTGLNAGGIMGKIAKTADRAKGGESQDQTCPKCGKPVRIVKRIRNRELNIAGGM